MGDAARWLMGQLVPMEETLKGLVETNSYTDNVEGGRQVGRLVDELFRVPGVEAELVRSESYADHRVYRTEGRPGLAPIALIGHLDTVFPPGPGQKYLVDGGLRRGPGVLDMKGGLVIMGWALKALARHEGLRAVPPLRVVVVSDEEVGSPEGAPLIRRVAEGCQAALVFEAGRAHDALITCRVGTGTVIARAVGRAAHAGNAYWDGASAIWALARFIDAAQRLSDRDSGTTVNVGLVWGGTAKNTVPAEARAEVDLRFSATSKEAALWRALKEAARTTAVEGTMVHLERGPGRPPMERQEGTAALLARYRRCALAHALGAEEAPLQGGGSDGNTTAAMGVPTLDGLGPRGRFFHTPDEYIEVDSLLPRAAALVDFLLDEGARGAAVTPGPASEPAEA